MANEITVQVSLAVNKGLLSAARQVAHQVGMAGSAMQHGVQAVGTSKENLVLGDVTDPGYVLMRNLDATNAVVFGADADSPFGMMKAGETALFRMAGTLISCKADTAAVNIEYWVLSD